MSQVPWHEQEWNIGTIVGLRAGNRAIGLIEHGTYADGTLLETGVHVLIGAEAGPVLYVQAAVHGDELNGIEALRRVVTALNPLQMNGVLIAVPVANAPGFVRHLRRNPLDNEDMNRVWPGKTGRSTSQQMAYDLYNQAIRHAQYVIDLHTASSNTLLHVVYGHGDSASRKLAEVFGLEILLEEAIDDDLKQSRFTGKLRNVLTAQGIPAITPELGGENYLEEENIVPGVRGIRNVMKYLGMLQGEIEPPGKPQITLHGSHLDEVWAGHGGIWVAQVKPGERVHEGQALGYIYTPRTFAIAQQVMAPYAGYVLGMISMSVVNSGDALINICRFEDRD